MVPQLFLIRGFCWRSNMTRVLFIKKNGQRTFFTEVLLRTGCVSLRALRERGIKIPYSTLKNYYIVERLMPLELFEELRGLGGLPSNQFETRLIKDHWGQEKGGKKGRRKKRKQ